MVTNHDLECNKVKMSDEHCFATSLLEQWHERLGHFNFLDVKRIRHHVDGMLLEGKAVEEVCETCETNKPKPRVVPEDLTTRSTEVIEIIPIDNLGPIAEEAIDGHKYAIGFADTFALSISVYFMRSREDCLEKFQNFRADIGKPRLIVLDGATEFVAPDFE